MRFWIATVMSLLALAGAACGDEGNGGAGSGADAEAPREITDATPGDAVTAADRAGVDVTGQETLISLSQAFRDALQREDVEVEALEPARMDGDTVLLPIDGGRVSVEDGGGSVDHSGTIVFRGDKETVELSDVFVDTRSGTVYAIVGGTRVRMFTLDTSRLDVQKDEDHLVAGDLQVRLAGDGAAVLEEELGASLEAGQEVGTMQVRLVPRLPAAAGAPEQVQESGEDAMTELRSMEERARALAEQAAQDMPAEDRRRLEEAARSLEEALSGS